MDSNAGTAGTPPVFAFPNSTPLPMLVSAPAPVGDASLPALDSLQGSGSKATPGPGSAALPMAATLPAAWLAPPAVPAPAVTAVPPPADAPVVAIADRRVRLGAPGAEEQPSLYRLCRQWVQNDPDLGRLPDSPTASKLPPLPAVSDEAAAVLQRPPPQEAPQPAAATAPEAAAGAGGLADQAAGSGDVGAGSSGDASPQVPALLKHHKEHWKEVRRHHQARAAAAQQRHGQRLQAVLALGGAPASAAAAPALPVPMHQ